MSGEGRAILILVAAIIITLFLIYLIWMPKPPKKGK